MFSLYRNQLIDLECKTTEWFLYDTKNGPRWVNTLTVRKSLQNGKAEKKLNTKNWNEKEYV